MTPELPQHACQSTYCVNMSRYWHGPIIFLDRPPRLIIGWCGLCNKFVCSDCALRLELPPSEHAQLPDVSRLEDLCRRSGMKLWRMHCSQCGTVLQISAYEPTLLICEQQYSEAFHLGES